MAEEKKKSEENGDRIDDIEKLGSIVTKNTREAIHCLSIIGQIEEIGRAHV